MASRQSAIARGACPAANYGVTTPLLFGVDRVCRDPGLIGAPLRVGLVTNDAARLASDAMRRSRSALLESGVPIVRLFGPEHGLSASAADGAAVADGVDPVTGLPVISLYGDTMRPTAAMLDGLDAVLFDIPDVGARFYTYTWTLYHLLAACADTGTRVVVLDRPNPLGGDLAHAEGPILDLSCRSFVGDDAIPITHQLTLGELATLWQREQFPALTLDVIAVAGWSRAQRWSDTALPWVPTSPSMPSFDSAMWYPGLCLFEATNLSVGRGTSAPFQRLGAPWLNADALMRDVAMRWQLELVRDDFTPDLAPYAAEHCVGVRLYPSSSAARPVRVGLQLLVSVIATQPEHFTWAGYPTAANPSGDEHFERLIGTRTVRPWLSARTATASIDELAELTRAPEWRDRVRPVLRYA